MALQGFDYEDLGGGLNEGQPWSALDPNEATILRNFYPFGRKLVRRGGVRKITTDGAWDETINSLFPLKKSDGTWVMLAGGSTKIGKLVGNGIEDLNSSLSISTSSNPWCWFQYKNNAYALRRGYGSLLRCDETAWYSGGIAEPTAAPTLADGGAGALSAANYYGVYTFYNTDTGMESNPSPASAVLALGGSKQISWTGIGVSTNSFVNARRLYRTLPGQVGEYFYVGMISDNTSTTFTPDNVIIADMGRSVSYDNGLPPASIETGVIWKERLFATDRTYLYYSEYLLPECFGEESILSVYPDDGHEIRGLHAFGDRLVIGKTNKMHYLVGADRNNFNILTLSDRHGCMSHFSMKSAEGYMFWYGTGNNFYRTDGNNVQEISTIKLRDTLDAIPDSMAKNVVAAVFPSLSWYVASVPQDETGTNSKVLVYNYKTDAWTIFDHPSMAPLVLSDYFDENLEQILYASFSDGHIYHYNDVTYNSDFGTAIDAHWVGRADSFGAPGYRKFFNEVWLQVPQVTNRNITLEAYYDEATSPSYSRTASLDVSNSAWKAYKFPTNGRPATLMRLGVRYSGDTPIVLEGVHMSVGLLARRPGQPR